MANNNYKYFLDKFAGQLPLGEAFDLVERQFIIGGKSARMYFVDGLTDGNKCQLLLNFMLTITHEDMSKVSDSKSFSALVFPFLDSSVTGDVDLATKQLYSGLVPLIIDGFDKIIIADAREYPQRGVEEPSKEKTLRGPKDGFTENFMSNLGLIRRRIRDNRLILKNYVIGAKTKTDVALCYMKGICDNTLLERVDNALSNLNPDSISVSDQSIVEKLLTELNGKKYKGRFSPFPKVRYTQRPDIISTHIMEGKLAIVVDNSPTVILLPIGIFDFLQDTDDYYFPLITGNYFRMIRAFNFIAILFLSPVYLLICMEYINTPHVLDFLVPSDPFALPIFWQFLLLELAVDGLKLASLNTPDSLGASLSVIGALILGQFSVDSGWFIPQTILIMAVVALAAFTQPSIELSFAIKFWRILILIGAFILGIWGFIVGFILGLLVLLMTKTISGHSYLYPLVPFDGPILKKLLFRTFKQ